MAHGWFYVGKGDLETEQLQCLEEGKDIAPLKGEFAKLAKLAEKHPNGEDPETNEKLGALLDKTALLKVRKGFEFVEPSALPAMRKARGKAVKLPTKAPAKDVLLEKAYGAWLGRCCGCMLGRPVEGKRRLQIETVLKSQGRWPLAHYWSGEMDPKVAKANGFQNAWFNTKNPMAIESMNHMVEDDDTNYTTTGLGIVKHYGPTFTVARVGEFWASNIPVLHTCTAERVAYRNYCLALPTVDANGEHPGAFSTATYRNPYREWIGAQIRADFFGYVCPANPERAAEFAWRDAALSHVKNGIYGEMWVAAMLAAAYVCDDIETVIRAGLAQIPAKSRLVRDIEEVFAWKRGGKTYAQVVDLIHAKWNEAKGHHWCQTNSNAQIVALALLWGEKDFEKTLCYAVMPAFDTDCNGATAGSVLGLMLGHAAIPTKWAAPLKDTLHTGVAGYHVVKLADMAKETVAMIEKVKKEWKSA